MSMNEEAAGLLLAVEALGESKNARRYGDELRRRVVRYTRARLREGESLKDVSKAIDVSTLSLQRFLEQVPELLPVAIVDPPMEDEEPSLVASAVTAPALVAPTAAETTRPTTPAPTEPRAITVHGPRGLRVDGLNVEEVAALFERMASCSA